MWPAGLHIGQNEPVLGAIVLVFALVFVFPPMVLMSGGAMAALLGWLLKADGDDRYANSELIELNT